MRTFDYSPFYRATVGFDRVFNLLDSVAGQASTTGYPPYNIEKSGDNDYRIVMAVAGFAEAELNVTQKENELLVTGQSASSANGPDEKQYLYRGIAGRNFERRFQLADHVKVVGAKLANGLLTIELQREIRNRIGGYASPTEFYISKIAEGVATIAAAFHPKPVIVRLSDFKSNEYSNLIGGQRYEPHEENPMLGFRGASRYIAPEFHDCFALECAAMKRVRDVMGLTNVALMIPFVRTLTEAERVIALLKAEGLQRGVNGLKVIMMCEIPSNAILADRFLEHFDGFSIGSNDMTQLTLAVDRDAGGPIAASFDERDDAVKAMLSMAITACRKAGKYVGICGQGPSDHPDLALWLVDQQIESMSLNPDTVVATWLALAAHKPG